MRTRSLISHSIIHSPIKKHHSTLRTDVRVKTSRRTVLSPIPESCECRSERVRQYHLAGSLIVLIVRSIQLPVYMIRVVELPTPRQHLANTRQHIASTYPPMRDASRSNGSHPFESTSDFQTRSSGVCPRSMPARRSMYLSHASSERAVNRHSS